MNDTVVLMTHLRNGWDYLKLQESLKDNAADIEHGQSPYHRFYAVIENMSGIIDPIKKDIFEQRDFTQGRIKTKARTLAYTGSAILQPCAALTA